MSILLVRISMVSLKLPAHEADVGSLYQLRLLIFIGLVSCEKQVVAALRGRKMVSIESCGSPGNRRKARRSGWATYVRVKVEEKAVRRASRLFVKKREWLEQNFSR
jgi:hypothetical protein